MDKSLLPNKHNTTHCVVVLFPHSDWVRIVVHEEESNEVWKLERMSGCIITCWAVTTHNSSIMFESTNPTQYTTGDVKYDVT